MNLWRRLLFLIQTMIGPLLHRKADPLDQLDHMIAREEVLLKNARSELIDIATLHTQLKRRADEILAHIDALESQSSQAINVGIEEVALINLKRRQAFITGLTAVNRDLATVSQLERQLLALIAELTKRRHQLYFRRNAMLVRDVIQLRTTNADLLEVQLEVRSYEQASVNTQIETSLIQDEVQDIKARLSKSFSINQ